MHKVCTSRVATSKVKVIPWTLVIKHMLVVMRLHETCSLLIWIGSVSSCHCKMAKKFETAKYELQRYLNG